MNKTKNKKLFMVVAVVLMVALVAAMGTITYSRYIVSSDLDPQQATAVKWGLALSANTSNFLSSDYSGTGLATPQAAGTGVAVKAANITVAPGTTGSMTITVSGTAEVRAQLSLSIAGGYTEISATTGGTTYKPVKWTLTKQVGSAEAQTLVNASEDLSDIADAMTSESAVIAANTACDTVYTLSWAWALETGADAAAIAANNKHDTAIGMYAKEANLTNVNTATGNTYTDIKPSFSFTLSATIQQIQ